MMSQQVSTPNEPGFPMAPTFQRDVPSRSFTKINGSDPHPTARSTLMEQHSLQQQLKRLFTLTSNNSGSPVAAIDLSIDSKLLALPEAVLDGVVGFALQGECKYTTATTAEAAAAIAVNRAIDLRALRASCRTLRVLADRQIGSLEVRVCRAVGAGVHGRVTA